MRLGLNCLVVSTTVRMVFEHQADYESQWAALNSIAAKIGCTAETLR
jgi:hypothetical protein